MIKGSEKRQASQPVHPLFIDRWSPRGMTGEAVSEQELMTMFEAARWAPSSNNAQPWRILYARRDTEQWPAFMELLFDGNRAWGERAGALLLFISHTYNDSAGRPSETHSFDAGAAWENLALQGYLLGLAVHGIAGFHRDRARDVLKIPTQFHLEAMVVVGRPGAQDLLSDTLKARETPNDRRPLTQTVCEGAFNW